MLPKTEFVGEPEVTMPLHPLMDEGEIEYIVSVITDRLSLWRGRNE